MSKKKKKGTVYQRGQIPNCSNISIHPFFLTQGSWFCLMLQHAQLHCLPVSLLSSTVVAWSCSTMRCKEKSTVGTFWKATILPIKEGEAQLAHPSCPLPFSSFLLRIWTQQLMYRNHLLVGLETKGRLRKAATPALDRLLPNSLSREKNKVLNWLSHRSWGPVIGGLIQS